MKPSKSHSGRKRAKKERKQSSPSPPQIQNPSRAATTLVGAPGIEEEADDDKKRRALDLDWLMGAFSSLSLDQILSAYDETGHDPFKAAGVLGTQLIGPAGATAAAEIEEIGEKEKKKMKKVAAASSGMVANVIGKGYAKPSSNCNRKKAVNEKERRYSIEEGEEFLCSMLGDDSELGMGVVKDVLCQCGYNVEKAMDALLDISACSLNSIMERDSGNYLCTYPELSSGNAADNDTDSLQSTDSSDSAYHLPEKENDILHIMGFDCRNGVERPSNSEERPLCRSRVIDPNLQQKVLESLFKVPQNRVHDPNGMNWKKVVQQVESFGQGLGYRNGNVMEPLLEGNFGKEDEYVVHRSIARKHWDTMRTYYQKAALAYSRGQRAHAAQLSETGRIHCDLARKADEKASRDIFQARNKGIKNTVTIDLHGQHVKQGVGLLKLHLLLFTYIPSVQFLKVITGHGGDGTGTGKLKRSVVALVNREGIEWCEENSGTLLLKLDGLKEYSFMEDEYDSDEN